MQIGEGIQSRLTQPKALTTKQSTFTLIICLMAFSCFGTAPVGAMQILRLDEDQMREILQYINAKDETNEEEGRETEQVEGEGGSSTTTQPEHLLLTDREEQWKAIDLSSPVYLRDADQEPSTSQCLITHQRKHNIQKKVRHFLHSQLQHIWSDQFGVQVLGMNVSIHSIRARHIRAPHIQLQPFCSPDGQLRLKASISAGSLSLHANYRSVYRTVRTGTFRVRLSDFQGEIGPSSEKCANAWLDQLKMHFKPKLLEEVDKEVEEHLRARVRHLLCERLPQFLQSAL